MKTEEFILVSDDKSHKILPYEHADLEALRKHIRLFDDTYIGVEFDIGFWKITVKSYFFGFYQKITREKLTMPL